ncbi:MAG: ABC transporter permease [Myxococcota bacterium]
MRLVYRLAFFLRSAVSGLRTSPLTSAVAVATIAITLLLAGLFVLVLGNMEDLLDRFGAHLQVTAYLEGGLSPGDQRELRRLATTVEGVEAVRLVSEQEALERFEAGVGAQLELTEVLEGNPLPASLEIGLSSGARTGEGARIVAEALRGLPGVAEIGHGQQWVEGYARALGAARTAALALGVVLVLATLLIVANTIRLAVYARHDEIEIQWLVGAGRTFIAIPFLVEGLLQGLLGAAIALGMLLLLYGLVLPGQTDGLEFVLGYTRPRFLTGPELTSLLFAGALLGGLGSASALVQGWRR